uniref:Protein LEG1 homolog n=1 Tax=Neogobius melanostomus TaxID=47308 RepID=A0A8C6UZV3_9GOBI
MSPGPSLTRPLSVRAMHAPLVCLLLSCAVALSGAGVVLDSGLPIMWGHTTGQLTDLPIIEGTLSPDPWHYLQRMTLYRLIIAQTDPFMTSMGPGENQSPVWGLPLQLGWMLSSGRLADPTGATTCGVQNEDTPNMCVSPSSWWGCVNYFSSVLPFLSAAHNGFFGQNVPVAMQIPAGVEGYCTTYDACKAAHPDAINNWDTFYQGLKDSISSTLSDNEKKDAILGLYWNAALASTHASSTCEDRLNSYSAPEKAFAKSWENAGEYVAAVYFQSSLEQAAQFMSPLPGRILREEDTPPNIPDLTAEENHSLYIFSWIQSMDSLMASTFGGTLAGTWRRAMCSVSSRESGRDMLKNLLFTQEGATANFLSIVSTMSLSCS